MRIEVRGDMAWVSHEAVIRRVAKPGGQLPPGTPPDRVVQGPRDRSADTTLRRRRQSGVEDMAPSLFNARAGR